ncbi:MAG: hypothetical protein LBU14_00635 [Candidatus Peribacteria bacterium]|jgi:hypothetical protein|nr:hypothetical protein [Candidatus Peribacteria bacterium]
MVPELLEDLGYKSAKALYEVVMQARYNKSQLSDETKEILSMFISSQYIIKD